MKNKDRVLNYLLTVSFVLLIFFFLLSLVGIARFVLSDATIGSHVLETKTLLEDIDEVQKVTKTLENETFFGDKVSSSYLLLDAYSSDIEDVAYRTKNNRTIITFIFNKTMEDENGIYFFSIRNISKLQKGVIVAHSTPIQTGIFSHFEEDIAIIIDSDEAEVERVKKEEIKGLVLFKRYQND